MQRIEPLDPVKQFEPGGMIAEKNGDPGKGVKKLSGNVGVNRHSAVRIGVPEREDTLAHAPGDVCRQGEMERLDVERDVALRAKQDTTKKDKRLRD
jgi:hypothetical protein